MGLFDFFKKKSSDEETPIEDEDKIVVETENTDDSTIGTLSNEIARRIQDEMTYPGQVKITVIRETRSVSFAKQTKPSKYKIKKGLCKI